MHAARLVALLLLAVALLPLGQPQPARATTATPAQQSGPPPVQLPPLTEGEGNNTLSSASPIGSASERSWQQQIQGAIGDPADVDYFAFTLTQAASSVQLRLDNLPADYDLTLAAAPEAGLGFEQGQPGLEGITQVGGQISAIGGQISAIGGQISAIGGQISAIGGQISAIGGQISAISATPGRGPEQIVTTLWLPGTYYVVVSSSNGGFSASPYGLNVTVSGSGLATPPPAPQVELRIPAFSLPPRVAAAEITTLYIVSPDRMRQRYPGELDQTRAISSSLQLISGLFAAPPNPAGAGPEWGAIISLSDLRPQQRGLPTIGQIYAAWDADQANPLAANAVAALIDNVIEAATTDGISGDATSAPYTLGGDRATPLISFPNVRNIVLVGGDDVIPGLRLPDLAAIANEADYSAYLRQLDPATGILDPNSPQAAAQRYRMLTSDAPYGSDRPYRFYGFPFYLPRLSVGRLVETPAEIAAYLANYVEGEGNFFPRYTIDLRSSREGLPRAFVSGYDFLKDQAAAITATLGRSGLSGSEIRTLIGDSWTATDLQQRWFDGRLDQDFSLTRPNSVFVGAPIPLFSLNTHFDHWQVLPASNANGTFPAARLLAPSYDPAGASEVPGGYFRNTLGYSVGCHSGYNVLGRAIVATSDQARYGADFAQALNRHGGNWIGNTGYGYGTADGIDYSERLATLFTEELARDVQVDVEAPFATLAVPTYVGQPIGDALTLAKQRYVRNSASLSEYDYKVLHVMTLYGLPFLRALVSEPQPPPPEDPRPLSADDTSVPLETPAPYPPAESGRLTRTITFTLSITDAANFRQIPRTGSTVIGFTPSEIAVEDEFLQRGDFPTPAVRIVDGDQPGAPSLPAFAYDLSAVSNSGGNRRLQVQDVVFLGGSYAALPNFQPQITQIVTETDSPIVATTIQPSFAAGAGLWYPDRFFGFSSVGEGEQQRDQLISAAAQFRADPNGRIGTLRAYRQLVFRVIYDDLGQTSRRAQELRRDDVPPTIESVTLEPVGPGIGRSDRTLLVVRAIDRGPDGSPGSGIDPADIGAVFVLNDDSWQRVAFTQRGEHEFVAVLPLGWSAVRTIVGVSDRAGNSSSYTARGSFQPPLNRTLVSLPLLRR